MLRTCHSMLTLFVSDPTAPHETTRIMCPTSLDTTRHMKGDFFPPDLLPFPFRSPFASLHSLSPLALPFSSVLPCLPCSPLPLHPSPCLPLLHCLQCSASSPSSSFLFPSASLPLSVPLLLVPSRASPILFPFQKVVSSRVLIEEPWACDRHPGLKSLQWICTNDISHERKFRINPSTSFGKRVSDVFRMKRRMAMSIVAFVAKRTLLLTDRNTDNTLTIRRIIEKIPFMMSNVHGWCVCVFVGPTSGSWTHETNCWMVFDVCGCKLKIKSFSAASKRPYWHVSLLVAKTARRLRHEN